MLLVQMVKHVPEFGEVARPPILIKRHLWKRGAFGEVVVIDSVTYGQGLQSRPSPHIPAEAEIALKSQTRLAGLKIGGMRISRQQFGRKLSELLGDIGFK